MISSNLVLVIGEQGGHLVKRPPPHRLVIPRRGQVVSDTLLVVPQQPVQGQHIGVADEGHGVGLGVVNGLAVRRDLDKESSAGFKVPLDKLVEHEHVLLLGKLHVVSNILQDL